MAPPAFPTLPGYARRGHQPDSHQGRLEAPWSGFGRAPLASLPSRCGRGGSRPADLACLRPAALNGILLSQKKSFDAKILVAILQACFGRTDEVRLSGVLIFLQEVIVMNTAPAVVHRPRGPKI